MKVLHWTHLPIANEIAKATTAFNRVTISAKYTAQTPNIDINDVKAFAIG